MPRVSVPGLERGDAPAQGLGDLRFREAWGDMLRTVPVEGRELKPEDPLDPGAVGGNGHRLRERRLGIRRGDLEMPVDLQPAPQA